MGPVSRRGIGAAILLRVTCVLGSGHARIISRNAQFYFFIFGLQICSVCRTVWLRRYLIRLQYFETWQCSKCSCPDFWPQIRRGRSAYFLLGGRDGTSIALEDPRSREGGRRPQGHDLRATWWPTRRDSKFASDGQKFFFSNRNTSLKVKQFLCRLNRFGSIVEEVFWVGYGSTLWPPFPPPPLEPSHPGSRGGVFDVRLSSGLVDNNVTSSLFPKRYDVKKLTRERENWKLRGEKFGLVWILWKNAKKIKRLCIEKQLVRHCSWFAKVFHVNRWWLQTE